MRPVEREFASVQVHRAQRVRAAPGQIDKLIGGRPAIEQLGLRALQIELGGDGATAVVRKNNLTAGPLAAERAAEEVDLSHPFSPREQQAPFVERDFTVKKVEHAGVAVA